MRLARVDDRLGRLASEHDPLGRRFEAALDDEARQELLAVAEDAVSSCSAWTRSSFASRRSASIAAVATSRRECSLSSTAHMIGPPSSVPPESGTMTTGHGASAASRSETLPTDHLDARVAELLQELEVLPRFRHPDVTRRDDRRLNGMDEDEAQVQPPRKRCCKFGSRARPAE